MKFSISSLVKIRITHWASPSCHNSMARNHFKDFSSQIFWHQKVLNGGCDERYLAGFFLKKTSFENREIAKLFFSSFFRDYQDSGAKKEVDHFWIELFSEKKCQLQKRKVVLLIFVTNVDTKTLTVSWPASTFIYLLFLAYAKFYREKQLISTWMIAQLHFDISLINIYKGFKSGL